MSWKLNTLSIVLLAAVCIALAIGDRIMGATGTPNSNRAPTVATAADTERTALSDADKEAIKSQKICPVSGQALGSMGEPIKVTAKGRTIFLCCSGCKKKFEADPDKYFKKLDEQKGKKK